MNKLCVFIHYSEKDFIPYSVQVYVNELIKYFDKIIIATNIRPIKNLDEINTEKISVKQYINQGYDFGLFYNVYCSLNTSDYETIACINDSNFLIGSLKNVFHWAEINAQDCWGILDADIKPEYSTHPNNYHIQSHFIVFNKKAIEHLDLYFKAIPIQQILLEKDLSKVKKLVINYWEIGLSQFLLSQNLTISTYINYKYFLKKYQKKHSTNISLKLYREIINSGLPIIKKRVLKKITPPVYINNLFLIVKKLNLNLNLNDKNLKREMWDTWKNYLYTKLK